MPKLTRYTRQITPTQGQSVISASVDAMGGGGAGLQQAGVDIQNFAQQMQKTNERSELSEARKILSKARMDWTVSLVERAQNMEDGGAGFTDTIVSDFDKAYEDVGQRFKTRAARDYFQENIVGLRGDLTVRAIQQQASAAAKKTRVDFEEALNNDGVTVFQDPTQFDAILDARLKAIDALPNLSDAARKANKEEAQQDLARKAVEGEIRLNAAFAKKGLESGKWDDVVKSDDLVVLKNRADAAIDAAERDAEDAARRAKEAEKARLMEIENDFVARLNSDGPETLSRTDVINSDLEPDKKRLWIGLIDAKSEKKPTTNPEVYTSLFGRIHAPDGSDAKILDEDELLPFVTRGELSHEDFNALRTEIQGSRSSDGKTSSALKDNFMRMARGVITASDPLFGIKDAKGDENLYKFQAWFQQAYDQKISEGASPMDLLNPNSPDYLGKALDAYRRTPQEIMRDTFRVPGRASLPAVSDNDQYESLEDLKAAVDAGVVLPAVARQISVDKGWLE